MSWHNKSIRVVIDDGKTFYIKDKNGKWLPHPPPKIKATWSGKGPQPKLKLRVRVGRIAKTSKRMVLYIMDNPPRKYYGMRIRMKGDCDVRKNYVSDFHPHRPSFTIINRFYVEDKDIFNKQTLRLFELIDKRYEEKRKEEGEGLRRERKVR